VASYLRAVAQVAKQKKLKDRRNPTRRTLRNAHPRKTAHPLVVRDAKTTKKIRRSSVSTDTDVIFSEAVYVFFML
jgi:hypothetical protein